MKMGFARVLALVLMSALLSAGIAQPDIYRNREFGITIPVPAGTLLCPTPGDEHDHGPAFLLGNVTAGDCHDSERRRSIAIFASYNAADVTKKLDDLLSWECVHAGKRPCRPAPEGLRIAGLRSDAARVNRSDGWIDVFVVTQAGKPDPAFDASVPSINYELRLHTTPRSLDDDLRIFRTMLATVQLFPEQADSKPDHNFCPGFLPSRRNRALIQRAANRFS